jgi:NitT/TauT family transport system substrate-binding protein
VPAVSNAGVYIADQRGFFTAEGLHVKLVSIASSADVLALLLDGNVDVLAGNYVSEIQAEANNPGKIRLRVLAEGALTAPRSREIMVPAGSPIRTLAQLRGKTVAVNALGNAASMLVQSALAANGIPASSVHLVAIGFPYEAAELNAHRPVDRTNRSYRVAGAADSVPGGRRQVSTLTAWASSPSARSCPCR